MTVYILTVSIQQLMIVVFLRLMMDDLIDSVTNWFVPARTNRSIRYSFLLFSFRSCGHLVVCNYLRDAIQHMFSKSVWNQGMCTILRDNASGLDNSSVNMKTRHKNAQITLGVGAALADVDIKIAVFRRPRTGNSFCFFDMESSYDALNLTQYEGYASRWVNKTYTKWLKDLNGTLPGFDDEMFIHSLHHAEKSQAKTKKLLAWEVRCLNKGSLCSSALVALLGRLIGLKPQGGGLENDGAKNAARDVLTSLVRVYDREFSINIKIE